MSHPQAPRSRRILSHDPEGAFDDGASPCFERANVVCYDDPASRSLWMTYRPSERPCYTPATLVDHCAFYDEVRRGTFGERQWLVFSAQPGEISSLGGDLRLFARCIREKDRASLVDYSRRCIEVLRAMHTGVEDRFLTVTMLQGEALGGGFEAVLGTDFVIAEEQARAGLPEVLFGLFPGMGALSFLVRRVGERRALELVRSGRILNAGELHDLGLIDEIVPRGEGPARVRAFLRERDSRWKILRTIRRAGQRVDTPSQSELLDVVGMWVDAAMDLDEYDLRKLEKIAGAQERMWNRVERPDPRPPWCLTRGGDRAPATTKRTVVPPAPPSARVEKVPEHAVSASTVSTVSASEPLARRLATRLDEEVDRFVTHPTVRALFTRDLNRREVERFAVAIAITHLCSPQVFALLYSLAPPGAQYALDNLREELGDAAGGHPAMFVPLFEALGYTSEVHARIRETSWDELQREFKELMPYRSIGEWGLSLLLEVGAFEWMLAREAGRLGEAIRQGLELAPHATTWFTHHAIADQTHAVQFLSAVEAYVEAYKLDAGVVREIIDTIYLRNPFVRWYVESNAASTLLAEIAPPASAGQERDLATSLAS